MKKPSTNDIAEQQRNAGWKMVRQQPALNLLSGSISFVSPDREHRFVARHGWIAISPLGRIYVHPNRQANPEHWARLFAIGLLCLGFGLVRLREPREIAELTALLLAERFCESLKIGRLPLEFLVDMPSLPFGGADALFQELCIATPGTLLAWGESFAGGPFFAELELESPKHRYGQSTDWKGLLARGIAQGVGTALRIAGGEVLPEGKVIAFGTPAQRAKRRLMDNHPLLGALAASFSIEEDVRLCLHYGVQVAAIDVSTRIIWMNPTAHLKEDEALFVFAHELLHAGLNHASRRRGRDPFLWNAACDFVINGWLQEMTIGSPPMIGVLLDSEFRGLSAEEIYDRLAQDIRRARKLATLRGTGQPDLIGADSGTPFVDAESYCRRALAQGLERWDLSGQRGTLPAGLVEEIRSLSQPPIPWDVKLAEWFDRHFPPPEHRRSYARPSRRQASTPDIPRPSLCPLTEEERSSRVFAVLLDTSGSMDPRLLGKALGAIASYSLSREVYAVRLICCDAQAHDSGWVEPENLIDRFTIRGRGGTVLQPGVMLLRNLMQRGDFPQSGPLLVITDGDSENRLEIPFEHAFLLPEGKRLPFMTGSEIFEIE
jgi:predicted metal-dependent peptidase